MQTQNDNRLLYRVIVKLMFLTGLLALAFAMLSSLLSPPNSQSQLVETNMIAEPVLVNLAQIPYGKVRNYRWNNQDIGILHLADDMKEQKKSNHNNEPQPRYFVFFNQGGELNCPLTIVKKQQYQLEDICSRTPYTLDGSLQQEKDRSRAKDLQIAPHFYRNEHQMMLGTNKPSS